MASYNTYYSSSSIPIPSKEQSYQYSTGYQSGGSTYSVSPPEDHDASASSAYGYSTTDSSAGDYYGYSQQSGDYYDQSSAGSASGVDFNEYIQDRFADSFDPIPLDRSLAVQAQT
jgi:biogenesis of lysosome-related organelles complex 1 subunit KXD1